MERQVREFRDEAERLLGTRSRRGACYPAQLKDLAVEIAQIADRHGIGVGRVAERIGVHADTLRKWRAESQPLSLVPVRIADPDREVHPVVVVPGGLRIEGLGLEGVAKLVRLLS